MFGPVRGRELLLLWNPYLAFVLLSARDLCLMLPCQAVAYFLSAIWTAEGQAVLRNLQKVVGFVDDRLNRWCGGWVGRWVELSLKLTSIRDGLAGPKHHASEQG